MKDFARAAFVIVAYGAFILCFIGTWVFLGGLALLLIGGLLPR